MLSAPPVEVPVQSSLDLLAPGFRNAVLLLLADLKGGPEEYPFETLRTQERQAYLYGFGREYDDEDDPRGIVTRASSALSSWHGFGLGVDIVEKVNGHPTWNAPDDFWEQLGLKATVHGLSWGGTWKHPDLPHIQWGGCPVSPTADDRALANNIGLHAVWQKYGAV